MKANTKDFSRTMTYYSGGGIYCYSTKYKDIYISGDIQGFGWYSIREEIISENEDIIFNHGWSDEIPFEKVDYYNYDKYWKMPSDGILPTFRQILESIKHGEINGFYDEIEEQMKRYHKDLDKRIDEE